MTDPHDAPSFSDDEYAFLRHVRFGELPPAVRPEERVALTETDPDRGAPLDYPERWDLRHGGAA
ncbi:hypothetical protein ACFOOK_32945 [Micromonospora krabiensis]|uniref:Uncharacterized protein n=1 Tax=Micromonospora krabiensis TaxID=307121 RepID=A0A1C3MYV1_9ACTN|nr:hypothetical protein [Micromonospora krabiensis]SBV25510.1 hypothetical protein GA0070620_0986 [Micromonospora krabiensis]